MTSRKRGYFLVTKVDFYMGSSNACLGRGICHFLRRDNGKLGFKIAGMGLDTPTVLGMSYFFYSVNGKNMKG